MANFTLDFMVNILIYVLILTIPTVVILWHAPRKAIVIISLGVLFMVAAFAGGYLLLFGYGIPTADEAFAPVDEFMHKVSLIQPYMRFSVPAYLAYFSLISYITSIFSKKSNAIKRTAAYD